MRKECQTQRVRKKSFLSLDDGSIATYGPMVSYTSRLNLRNKNIREKKKVQATTRERERIKRGSDRLRQLQDATFLGTARGGPDIYNVCKSLVCVSLSFSLLLRRNKQLHYSTVMAAETGGHLERR